MRTELGENMALEYLLTLFTPFDTTHDPLTLFSKLLRHASGPTFGSNVDPAQAPRLGHPDEVVQSTRRR
jgi:hypothetical protein